MYHQGILRVFEGLLFVLAMRRLTRFETTFLTRLEGNTYEILTPAFIYVFGQVSTHQDSLVVFIELVQLWLMFGNIRRVYHLP